MEASAYRTPDGVPVAAVTADEMRGVDRLAVEAGLTLPRMMEHAGRSLARQALELRRGDDPAVVLAGGGGNGGGGMVCARHLANRGIPTYVALDRSGRDVSDVPGEQLSILRRTPAELVECPGELPSPPSLVVDAVLGYGLRGAPRGSAADLLRWSNHVDGPPVVSLDVPSGVEATTGATPGAAVEPDRTVTLALPKTGLTQAGDIRLADLSIPISVFDELDIPYQPPFGDRFVTPLTRG